MGKLWRLQRGAGLPRRPLACLPRRTPAVPAAACTRARRPVTVRRAVLSQSVPSADEQRRVCVWLQRAESWRGRVSASSRLF